MAEDLHLGHRERMREKLEHSGAGAMSSYEMLELLLYHCLPRVDTEPLAARLLQRFDSFSGVLQAPVAELMEVEGIGRGAAEFLHSFPKMFQFYMEDLQTAPVRVFHSDAAYSMLKSKFYGCRNEIIVLLILNSRGQAVYHNKVAEGSVAMVPVYIKKIVGLCLEYDADAVILAHNHPSGNPTPSHGDIVATKEIQIALESIYVTLADHLIFTDTDYISMKKCGILGDVERSMREYRQSALRDALQAEDKYVPGSGQ